MKEDNKHCKCLTRCKIIKSAEALFSKYGYASVSMDDIAREVKITKAALYYHFDGKEKLFLEMMEEGFSKFDDKVLDSLKSDNDADTRFRQFIIDYIEFALKRKSFIKIMVQKFSGKDKSVIEVIRKKREEMAKIIEPFIKDIFEEKGFGKECDSYFATFMFMGILHNVIADELIFQNHKWSSEHIADQILMLMPAKK